MKRFNDTHLSLLPLRAELMTRIEELGRNSFERTRWLPHQLRQFPDEFRDGLLDEFEIRIGCGQHVDASLYFFELRERLQPKALSLAASDDEIVKLADTHAQCCAGLAGRGSGPPLAWFHTRMYAREAGVAPPLLTDKVTAAVAVKMLCDPLWWRRQLRTTHARAVEHEAIRLGLVRRGRDLYVSGRTFTRWQQQTARNRRVLADLTAINELGEEFSLDDLAGRSVANPRCRRAELMVRLSGFEKHALEQGHAAVMYTVTCPSRMHARLAQTGAANPRYDGISPADAQDYLCNLWRRARAALHREGLRVYGIRVAEPQHDGTPHWHILLFMPPLQVEEVGAILRAYALAADPDEPGAAEHRITAVAIDHTRGSATGYLAKYISKNVDGEHLEKTDAGAVERAQRTRAWASVWGIRQFQQIGNPIVTIWRELRRGTDAGAEGVVQAASAAANEADWKGFVQIMGGPQVARGEMPIQLLKADEVRVGRYGQAAAPAVVGVTSADGEFKTRHHSWTIVPGSANARRLEFCQ